MVRALLRPRFWGAHLLVVAALAAAIALGIWQLHVWQAARDSEALDLTKAAPLPLTKVMSGDDPFPGQYLGQPVTLAGQWLPRATLYVSDRDHDGRSGFWVMTPVQVGQSAMPVVRGWSSRADAPEPSGDVTVQGWLQPSEGSGAVDDDSHDDVIPEVRIASMVEHVDADLYSGFVVAQHSAGSAGAATAYDGLAAVTPESIPEVSSTTSLRNLLYAFQWWVFGGFAVYVWGRWCRDTWEEMTGVEQVASQA